ncbi:MAG: HAD family hydrolase [Bacteroidales bacterium]
MQQKGILIPTIALIYDFDGTLSPKNMQEYDFFKAIKIGNKDDFWRETTKMVEENDASNILCYMKLMIDKASENGVSIKKKQFRDFGKSIKLFPGVLEWFDRINKIGEAMNVHVEHYINSSGLKEMIEGTSIAKEFKEIYACSFMYDVDGIAKWPGVAVDFTAKTQFMYMINKGISKVSDNKLVNKYVQDCDRPIPFAQMIYFGDGETDIPCMKLVKNQGGHSIAVYKLYKHSSKVAAEQLVSDHRANFMCVADYREGKNIEKVVSTIMHKVKYNWELTQEEKKHFQKAVKDLDK